MGGVSPPDEVATRLQSVLAAADSPRETVLQGLPGLLGPAVPQESVDELMDIWMDSSGSRHPGGYRATAHSMAEADLRGVLPEIRVPTLLLYGELDQRAPLSVARDLHAAIPGAELVVIPGVGHLTNIEAPEEFNSQVRRFIHSVMDEVDPGAASGAAAPAAPTRALEWSSSILVPRAPSARASCSKDGVE